MNPFFISYKGTVVPFSVITAVYILTPTRIDIDTINKTVHDFTFKDENDCKIQYNNYISYLRAQFNPKELL